MLQHNILCVSFSRKSKSKVSSFLLASELLTACSPTDVIHHISTISKHLLEKSEAICCLFCLFGNVTWLHTNTSSQCSPLPSLKRNAERCWQGDSTQVCRSSTPVGWAWLLQPHMIGSEGHPSAWVVGQYGFRRGAEVTKAACVDLLLREDLPRADSQYVGGLSLSGSRRPADPSGQAGDLSLAVWLNICPRGVSTHILCHHYFIASRSFT